jgi:hypothetical protein
MRAWTICYTPTTCYAGPSVAIDRLKILAISPLPTKILLLVKYALKINVIYIDIPEKLLHTVFANRRYEE